MLCPNFVKKIKRNFCVKFCLIAPADIPGALGNHCAYQMDGHLVRGGLGMRRKLRRFRVSSGCRPHLICSQGFQDMRSPFGTDSFDPRKICCSKFFHGEVAVGLESVLSLQIKVQHFNGCVVHF